MSLKSQPGQMRKLSKYLFVTVGASASFKTLIKEVISPPFVEKLKSFGFTHIVVQCGPDYGYFEGSKPNQGPEDLDISGFAYKKDLREAMSLATADDTSGKERARGLIITHAGSGSILDALDYDAALIAVPNPALMGNHQSEIADEMEKEGFLIQGKVGSLVDVINEDMLNAPKKEWPPPPDEDSVFPGGLWQAITSLLPERPVEERGWWFSRWYA
ncbi:glycosyltransferase family 1 protein [Hypoxylon sp. NC1633]|nr:glycosyltransferase family 1 protein [Hypoxylon sp. NC1633]